MLHTHTPSSLRPIVDATLRLAHSQQQRSHIALPSTLTHLPRIPLYQSRMQPYLRGHPRFGMVLKMRFRTGSATLAHPLFRRGHPNARDPNCQACRHIAPTHETVEHFLLHCSAYADLRSHLQATLNTLLPGVRVFTADPTATTALLLSDMPWSRRGVLQEANDAVFAFLEGAWAVRQAALEAS